MAGKKGNRVGEWFFEYSVEGLRKILSIKDKEYQDVRNFHRRCIDLPLQEVNEKGLGFTIEVEKIKSGNKIVMYRFNCKETSNVMPKKSEMESDDYDLIKNNREMYMQLLEEEPEPEPAFPGQLMSDEWKSNIKMSNALSKLKASITKE